MKINHDSPALFVAALLTISAAFSTHQAQAEASKPRELTAEEKVVADQANAYIAAYNKGDAKTITTFFAEDAEWVDDEGQTTAGQANIGKMLAAALSGSKGRKLDINVDSVRPVTADVLLEKGTIIVTEADGRNAVSSYTAVHAKKDGKWLISQFTETGAPSIANAETHLRELEWLVGDWVDRSEGIEMKTKVAWTTNRTFLTRSFSVMREGAAAHDGTEVIGWDPTLGKVRSWVFEADGSFSENVWTQDGTRWLIQSKTTLPDGGLGSAQHTLTWKADGKFTWSSANRQLDGELRPNIDPIEIIRAK